MAASEFTRMARRSAALLIGLVVVAVLAIFILRLGSGSEFLARFALNRVVHKEVKQFNKYHQREVKPNVYESGGRFYRIYHERVDPVVNMRRTNSIDTPYIATISFTENIYLTKRHGDQAECRRDSHFILSNTSKREIVYAYVNGSWKKKEVY